MPPIPRISIQFWASYVDCNSTSLDAVQLYVEQIDVIKRLTSDYPNDMSFATNVDQI